MSSNMLEPPTVGSRTTSEVLIGEARKQTLHLAYIREVAKLVKAAVIIWLLLFILGIVAAVFYAVRDTRTSSQSDYDAWHQRNSH